MKKFHPFVLVLLFFCTVSFANSIIIPNYSEAEYKAIIEKIYQNFLSPQDNLDIRIKKLSHFFLGKPYILGSLGEGKTGKFDQSPLYRTDAFDCVTYVSTILALAKSNNFYDFEQTLKKIQYRNSNVTYETRFHFIELDWNRQNQLAGFIQDITANICKNCRQSSVIIDKPAWFKNADFKRIKLLHSVSPQLANKLLAELRNHAYAEAPTRSSITYIPLTELFVTQNDIFNQIPTPAIIEIVDKTKHLKKKISTDLNVVHLGFVININHELIFRYASTPHHKVVDVPLIQYLARYYKRTHQPQLIGINVQKIL